MNLSAQEARARFEQSPSAVLGTVDTAGQPHLVPVTYVLSDEEHVYIAVDAKPKRSTNLRRLQNIEANPLVSLLVNEYSDNWDQLWWARADGTAVVSGFGDLAEGLLARFQSRYPWYRANPPESLVIDICVTRWSGWAFAG